MAKLRRVRGEPSTIAESEEIVSATASDAEEAAHSGLVPQLGMMVRALSASPVGKTIIVLMAEIFLVVVATTYGQIRLNR